MAGLFYPADPAQLAADVARHLSGATLDVFTSEPLAPEVAEVCASPALPPMNTEADVYAYAPDGERVLGSHLLALCLSDGSVWVTRSDPNGHLRLSNAPAGALALEDPAATPLEP